MSVQPQWSLDRSAVDVISLAKGVLQAATTDNVQVLAILACERFGATLAMSQATNRKMELEVIPTPDPTLLAFLKVHVGYSRNDCVEQFGKSLAGIQFLGLATALTTTTTTLNGAISIQEMLVDTAEDKALVPTVRQIQHLLNSIEPKCQKAGFASEVAGWQIYLNGTSPEHFKIWNSFNGVIKPFKSERDDMNLPRVPEPKGIQNLVTAFRELQRIGSTDITEVFIHTPPSCAAWTVAFVKWCLGAPPSIAFEDGTTFPGEETSRVRLSIGKRKTQSFQVKVYFSTQSPWELIETGSGSAALGMMKPSELATLLLQSQQLDFNTNEDGNRALLHAIPFALNQILDNLNFTAECEGIKVPSFELWNNSAYMFRRYQLSPFKERMALSQAYRLFYGLKEARPLPKLQEGYRIQDLPSVRTYVGDLRERCECYDCHPEYAKRLVSCVVNNFWKKLCIHVATVLSLALFHNPDDIRLCIDLLYAGASHDILPVTIFDTLIKGGIQNCPIEALHTWALKLIGHPSIKGGVKRHFPLLSAHMGQAAWLTIHQSYQCVSSGFLSFSWLPGIIMYDKEPFNSIVEGRDQDTTSHYSGKPSPVDALAEPVLSVRNLCSPSAKVLWTLRMIDDRVIEASLRFADLGFGPGQRRSNVFGQKAENIPSLLACAALVPDCKHPLSSRLDQPDQRSAFIGPVIDEVLFNTKVPGYVNIVAVDGKDDLRYLALDRLTYRLPIDRRLMIRRSACLECCLQACREAGCEILVL